MTKPNIPTPTRPGRLFRCALIVVFAILANGGKIEVDINTPGVSGNATIDQNGIVGPGIKPQSINVWTLGGYGITFVFMRDGRVQVR